MKSQREKKDSRFFIVMLAAALISCVLTNASYSSGVSNFAASAIGVVVTPIQGAFSGMHNFFEEKLAYFSSVDELREENEKLKDEITELNRKVSELEPAAKETEMLYNFLELKRERNDIKFVNAEIISRSVSNYTSDFTIDKGSVHGIEKDMAVVAEDNSLLGIIVEVGATYARGKTLTSYDLNVGIKNERTGQTGILTGTLELSKENLCRVADLAQDDDYVSGDIIRTSGLGDIYPPGIYVGSVTELVPDPLSYTVSAVVKPSSNIFECDMVMVITDFDRSYVDSGEVLGEDTANTEQGEAEVNQGGENPAGNTAGNPAENSTENENQNPA